MFSKVTEDIYYVGVNDHDIDLFEGQYDVPNGMAYNSYVVMDEKTVLLDTVDHSVSRQFMENVRYVLGGKKLDYLLSHILPHQTQTSDVW